MPYYGSALLVGSDTTPFITAYQFVGGNVHNGFSITYPSPVTLPTGTVNGIAFSPNGQYVAFALATSPYIMVYSWSNANGFGAVSPNPVTLPTGAANYVAWSPDGAYVGVATGTSPYQAVYPFSGGALGAKVADPGTALPGACNAIAWSPDGAYVGFASGTTPYIVVENWSAGYGAKVADPVTLPGNGGEGIAWSPSGADVATHGSSRLVGYPWSAGFGVKFTNTGAQLNSNCAWSPDGGYIASGSAPTSTGFRIVSFAAGAFTSTTGYGQAHTYQYAIFKPTGDFLVATVGNTPYVEVYPWSSGVLGSALTQPTTLPPVTTTAAGVAWAIDTYPPAPPSPVSLASSRGAMGGFLIPTSGRR